jgi:hypothetical protein
VLFFVRNQLTKLFADKIYYLFREGWYLIVKHWYDGYQDGEMRDLVQNTRLYFRDVFY